MSSLDLEVGLMGFLEGVTPAEDGGPWRVTDQPCSLSLPSSSSSGSRSVCTSIPRSLWAPLRHFWSVRWEESSGRVSLSRKTVSLQA